jgi:hypothetical protein
MVNRRNLIVAVLLCIGILVVWDRFFLPRTQPPAQRLVPPQNIPLRPTAPKPPSESNGAIAKPASRGAEERVTLTTRRARLSSLRGMPGFEPPI